LVLVVNVVFILGLVVVEFLILTVVGLVFFVAFGDLVVREALVGVVDLAGSVTDFFGGLGLLLECLGLSGFLLSRSWLLPGRSSSE
jgi:hypothetical protein